MKSILFVLVLMFLIVPVSAVDWHDDSRVKRVQLNVNNSSVALSEYQLMKNIIYDSDMQPDFDDLLFYNESGGNVFYWIESKTDSVSADIWLKIPSISTTTGAKVWMYYGNSEASSASSITDTMIFGDDFPGSSINTSKWTVTGTINIADGIATFPTSSYNDLISQTVFSGNIIVTSKFKASQDFWFGTSSGSATQQIYVREADAIKFFDVSGWGSTLDSVALNSNYNIYEQRYGTYLSHYYNGAYKTIGAQSASLTNQPVSLKRVQDATAYAAYVDYIYVRKYTATEPTWGADGEEESYEAPPALNGTFLYPNSTYSDGCYGKLISELVYETGFNFSDIGSYNTLTAGNMETLSVDDTNYIPSIDKDAAHDGYMYGNFSLPNVESVNFINVKTVHNRNETNPVILGLFNTSTQKWHAVNNSSVEIVDVELTYNITGTDIAKYTTLIDNTLNLSVSLNTNGDGNYDVFVDFVEVYIDYEESPGITLEYVYNLTISNQNDISILQNDVDDLENNVNNLYLFVLLCAVFLFEFGIKRRFE